MTSMISRFLVGMTVQGPRDFNCGICGIQKVPGFSWSIFTLLRTWVLPWNLKSPHTDFAILCFESLNDQNYWSYHCGAWKTVDSILFLAGLAPPGLGQDSVTPIIWDGFLYQKRTRFVGPLCHWNPILEPFWSQPWMNHDESLSIKDRVITTNRIFWNTAWRGYSPRFVNWWSTNPRWRVDWRPENHRQIRHT